MNQEQLNRIATFLEMLNSAEGYGVRLDSYYEMRLVVDDEETGLKIGHVNDQHIVEPLDS